MFLLFVLEMPLTIFHTTDISHLKRKNLINFIWKNTIPYSSSISIDKNIKDDRYQNLSNLKSINKLNIEMKEASQDLNFELAIQLRDQIEQLNKELSEKINPKKKKKAVKKKKIIN